MRTILPQEQLDRGLWTRGVSGDRLGTEPEQQQLVNGAGLANQIWTKCYITNYAS